MVYVSEDSRKCATRSQIEYYENFFSALEKNPLDSADVDDAYHHYRSLMWGESSVGIISNQFLTEKVENAYRRYNRRLPWRRLFNKCLSLLNGNNR
jgi:hypothetical protein